MLKTLGLTRLKADVNFQLLTESFRYDRLLLTAKCSW